MNKKPKCGIIMPISKIENCSEKHWTEVLSYLKKAIREAGFEPSLVCDSNSTGIIQEQMLKNIYKNPMIVCDVSCRNPNVMFELGLRLALNKPVLVIKDNQTPFSFDIAPIEHLLYDRSLRHNEALFEFRKKFISKLKLTYEESINNPNFSIFMTSFISDFSKPSELQDIKKNEFKLKLVHMKESEAKTVWVVSPKLYYDVHDPIFKELVKKNINKNIVYKYIVPDSIEVRENIQEFKQIYNFSDNEIKKTFIVLPNSSLNNFIHEIVIYNGNLTNYFSYLFSRNNAKEKDDIMIFTKEMSIENIRMYKEIWKQNSKHSLFEK